MIEYCSVRIEVQTREQVDDFITLLREENEENFIVSYPTVESGFCAEIRDLPWAWGDPGESVREIICETIRQHLGKPLKAEYADTDASRERTTHYDYDGDGLLVREIEGETLISECESCGADLWAIGGDAEVVITPENVFDVFRCPNCGEILFRYGEVNPLELEYREEQLSAEKLEQEPEKNDLADFLDAFTEIAEYDEELDARGCYPNEPHGYTAAISGFSRVRLAAEDGDENARKLFEKYINETV